MADNKLNRIGKRFAQSLRLMIGVPEYSAYVEHMKNAHHGQAIMSREAFFRERMEARYGGKGRMNRCC
ncbi:YbdD/YjiX family protein [Nitrosomonas sp.]|uniref:YbdD/YjiX family protein n=1 Tax=Nitrosomonas sp. TaxID=42353 RepID=UPI0025F8F2C1|nr:YbdD/YjiX family protein [Nitrosomonas sp.]MCC6915736.1 YbdD/YjiX family protein [Nitrosomonas sp.]